MRRSLPKQPCKVVLAIPRYETYALGVHVESLGCHWEDVALLLDHAQHFAELGRQCIQLVPAAKRLHLPLELSLDRLIVFGVADVINQLPGLLLVVRMPIADFGVLQTSFGGKVQYFLDKKTLDDTEH